MNQTLQGNQASMKFEHLTFVSLYFSMPLNGNTENGSVLRFCYIVSDCSLRSILTLTNDKERMTD